MKFDFGAMDIGSFTFNFVRTLSVAATGGADLNECLAAASAIRDNDTASWIAAWAALARKVEAEAQAAFEAGQVVTARQAWLRASNYYRSAMFLMPRLDPDLDRTIARSRACFQRAAALMSPAIEGLEIPCGKAKLPGYFLSCGKAGRPTLIAVNGADSTNEELVHWIGFAAVSRGWNCLIFEGPGQWNALQINPGLYLEPDYETAVAAVVDALERRPDVDTGKLALIGYSLGALLAARVAACESRIGAYVFNGLVTDVNEAWTATMPAILRAAPPFVFDAIFAVFERTSPQLRGLANHFKWMLGVQTMHDIFSAWPAYNVKALAERVTAPVLLLYGEGEFAETGAAVAESVLDYISRLNGPVDMHVFDYGEGWAASHCQVGGLSAAQGVIFDWLDRTVCGQAGAGLGTSLSRTWDIFNRYHKTPATLALQARINANNRTGRAAADT